MKTIGDVIREIRKERAGGLSQEAFGESVGLSASYIGAMERNHRAPSEQVARRIATRYARDPADEEALLQEILAAAALWKARTGATPMLAYAIRRKLEGTADRCADSPRPAFLAALRAALGASPLDELEVCKRVGLSPDELYAVTEGVENLCKREVEALADALATDSFELLLRAGYLPEPLAEFLDRTPRLPRMLRELLRASGDTREAAFSILDAILEEPTGASLTEQLDDVTESLRRLALLDPPQRQIVLDVLRRALDLAQG